MLSISLLGDFCIRQDEAPVTNIDTPRLQSLLAYLILHRDAPQSRAHLAYLFWPDTSEAQARTNLRNLLHHLRCALPNADSHIDSTMHTLQWRGDTPFALDVDHFNLALTHAKQAQQMGKTVAVREALERATALYMGDLLPSCYDDWIIPQREGLRQAYLTALEQLVGMLEEQRDYQGAIRSARRILRHDPLHEAAYRRLIRLHALNGDRAGALRIYHTCTTILQRELGVEPGAATRQAYEQLLGEESQSSTTVPPTIASSTLVGRVKEWTQMLQAWRAVVEGGEAHMMILRGEAGIGKTRLVEELLQWVARQGQPCASTRCYAAEGDLAYAPATAWLRAHPLVPMEDIWLAEVARLLPEVLVQRPALPRPVALTEAWQRQRFFEALTRAILGLSQPLLLTIDDLQWCDRDTLEWLHFLLRFDRAARLLIVGAYRPEEIGGGHPLLSLLQALRLEGQLTEIDLQPLDEAATQILAELVADGEIGSETAHLLYQETEGNPLFVVETVRAGLSGHGLRLNTGLPGAPFPSFPSLPPKVQSVLETRLAQLSPSARELAGLAATLGREFSFKLLAEAGDFAEDTLVSELDELWRRRIIREHGVDAYDFSHDKLREVAYHSMSLARKRLLHRHVAQALEKFHATELDPVSRQLAAHYEHAGLPEQAIPYYLRAATVAHEIYANEEALSLLQRGLALVENVRLEVCLNARIDEYSAHLWDMLGDIRELKVQHQEALQAYTNAQSGILPSASIWQARLHRKVGMVFREQRLYAEALEACHRAELALGHPPAAPAGEWWDEWLDVQVDQVWAYYWLARWPEMEALVNKVQPVVQERGSGASRMRFLLAFCLMHLRKERYKVSDEMLANSLEALALSMEWGSLKTRLECQFELGFLCLWRGELNEADKNLQAALEMAETLGIVPFRILSLTYLTVTSRFRNDLDGVMDYMLRARAAAKAAHMPDYVAAAQGNQAWLAWRKQDLPAAESSGQEALALWRQSPLVYPFQWQALWPLTAVAWAGGREDQAWEYIQALLQPAQQLLPDKMNDSLEIAVQAKTGGQAGVARSHLECAMEIAQGMGYL